MLSAQFVALYNRLSTCTQLPDNGKVSTAGANVTKFIDIIAERVSFAVKTP